MVCYLILTDDDKSPTEVSFQGVVSKKKLLVQKEAVKSVASFNHQERTGQQPELLEM